MSMLQVRASAWGTQFLALQGFFLRGAADSSSSAAQYNYTLQRDLVTTTGGAHFISTYYEDQAPASLGPSNYTVRAFCLSSSL